MVQSGEGQRHAQPHDPRGDVHGLPRLRSGREGVSQPGRTDKRVVVRLVHRSQCSGIPRERIEAQAGEVAGTRAEISINTAA